MAASKAGPRSPVRRRFPFLSTSQVAGMESMPNPLLTLFFQPAPSKYSFHAQLLGGLEHFRFLLIKANSQNF